MENAAPTWLRIRDPSVLQTSTLGKLLRILWKWARMTRLLVEVLGNQVNFRIILREESVHGGEFGYTGRRQLNLVVRESE